MMTRRTISLIVTVLVSTLFLFACSPTNTSTVSNTSRNIQPTSGERGVLAFASYDSELPSQRNDTGSKSVEIGNKMAQVIGSDKRLVVVRFRGPAESLHTLSGFVLRQDKAQYPSLFYRRYGRSDWDLTTGSIILDKQDMDIELMFAVDLPPSETYRLVYAEKGLKEQEWSINKSVVK